MKNLFEEIPKYTRAILKAHLASMGYEYTDFDKPIIGIVNSWNEVCPGHYPLREIANKVKNGVMKNGGLPLEFNTIALCDAFGQGNKGMHYMLPSREIIADSIEVMVKGEMIFSGLVFITACDKITPAMLMAASRINLPSIFVTSGPMNHLDSVTTKDTARSLFRDKKISEVELVDESLAFYSGPGVCPFLGTANTMLAMAETLGMMLPGTSFLPSGTALRFRASQLAGKQILQLIKENLRPSDILTREAFLNAVKVLMAIGGSLNALLHLPAVARELKVCLTWDDFDIVSQSIPFLTPITPNGPYSVKDLQMAGGIPAVMKEISEMLDYNVKNVSGISLREIVFNAKNQNQEIIHNIYSPISEDGGIAILKGNLAEVGAIVKKSAVPKNLLTFKGPAKVFNSEEECTDAIISRTISDGDVLVVRYEGPKGGPGMPEMHRLTELIKGLNVAIVTDGRFSGATGGLSIGYVTPEAYEGGNIALVCDGDIIEIDIPKRYINLVVDDTTLNKRRKSHQCQRNLILSKFLTNYQSQVGSAAQGACTYYFK